MTLLDQLHQLAPLAAAATKAPWTWDLRPQSHTISLMSGWDTVLDTKRWGSQGATIRMVDPENPSCLLPLHVDAVPHEGRAHHKDWALTVNPARTNAAFIAAARNVLTPENLALLVAALESAQAQEVTAAQRDGALLYAEACDKRLHQLIESAMQPLPSYEEMMAAAMLKGDGHV